MTPTLSKEHLIHNAVFVGDRKELSLAVESKARQLYGEGSEFFKITKFEVSVDDVREVREWIYSSSTPGMKCVIISSFYWNVNVQNALLKILEDTPVYAKLFLIAEDAQVFLKTITSRVFAYDFSDKGDDQTLAKNILKKEIYERLQDAKVKKILLAKVENKNTAFEDVEDFSEDDNVEEGEELGEGEGGGKKRQDRERHIQFFDALTSIIINKWREERFLELQTVSQEYIDHVERVSREVRQFGGKPALCIEYILLTCPMIV